MFYTSVIKPLSPGLNSHMTGMKMVHVAKYHDITSYSFRKSLISGMTH